jgi:hypothetical protein
MIHGAKLDRNLKRILEWRPAFNTMLRVLGCSFMEGLAACAVACGVEVSSEEGFENWGWSANECNVDFKRDKYPEGEAFPFIVTLVFFVEE